MVAEGLVKLAAFDKRWRVARDILFYPHCEFLRANLDLTDGHLPKVL